MGPPLTCRGYESDDHAASFSNHALLPVHPTDDDADIQLTDPARRYAPESWDWLSSPLIFDGVNHSLAITDHLLAAPGVCIPSTIRAGEFAFFSGTSQSCPYVSGILALEYGSGGMAGPCSGLTPIPCMLRLVRRAQEMEARARLGYGYLPWPVTSAQQLGTGGTDIVIVEVDVILRPPTGVGPRPRAATEGFGSSQQGPSTTGPRNMTAIRLMRRYYGPLVVGRQP
jgi:subtilisin family serine protease